MNAAAGAFDGLNKYIRITDIDEKSRCYIDENPVSPKGELDDKYLVLENDILFARTGASTGKTYLYKKSDGKLYFAGFLIRISVNCDNNSTFVYNATLTDRYNRWVRLTSMRSGQPGINSQEYSSYKTYYPLLPEQNKIASFLKKLDQRIEKQHQLVELLKSYKRGALSKLFPQKGETTPQYRFVGFTEPWELRKLGDMADIVGGGTPSTIISDYWNGDIDWYSPAELSDQIYLCSSQKKITEQGYINSSAKMLPEGSVLFTSRAGIGKTAILTRSACTNQGFQSIVPHKGELDSYFIYSRTEEMKAYGETAGAGSTFVEVSGKQMANMKLMMPKSIDEQKTIGDFFQRFDQSIVHHQSKLDGLLKVKSALLQQLFI